MKTKLSSNRPDVICLWIVALCLFMLAVLTSYASYAQQRLTCSLTFKIENSPAYYKNEHTTGSLFSTFDPLLTHARTDLRDGFHCLSLDATHQTLYKTSLWQMEDNRLNRELTIP